MKLPELPIDKLIPELLVALKQHPSVVLEAPPGAGKTTRVPRAFLEHNVVGKKEIVVLQPRRLPTRLAANRVAEELGEPLGQRVGYQVRFEDVSSSQTRLKFVTEGVLTRRMLRDPSLNDVGLVVLDEFHERHLASDLALALLRRLQKTSRPDLKLLVMSATLESASLQAFLDGAPIVRSEGRQFEVSIDFLPTPDERPLEELIVGALKRSLTKDDDGDILAFLPGAAEIRRAQDSCRDFASRHGLDVLPLHGNLPPAEQDRAVRPGQRQKLILSTNVAETSVTLPKVTLVLDSGLARIASYSPWTGLPALKLSRTSKASATQRAGRAGRVRPGRCLRLYTKHDFQSRPEFESPEISRMDLAETLLALHAQGIKHPSELDFFEAPPASSLAAADELLRMLGAVTAEGLLSEIGQRLLQMPLHPRMGRLMVEAEQRGIPETGAIAAAILGERDIRVESRMQTNASRQSSRATVSDSDVSEMIERFRAGQRARFSAASLRGLGLEQEATLSVERVRQQLLKATQAKSDQVLFDDPLFEQSLGLSMLAAFPDRVARRRRAQSNELILSSGGTASLSEASSVREAALLVTVDVEERSQTRGTQTLVRLASAVEPEWLLELFPNEIIEKDELVWNDEAKRVDRLTQMAYQNIVLEEVRQPAPYTESTSAFLAQHISSVGLSVIGQQEAWSQWQSRKNLLEQAFSNLEWPSIDQAFLEKTLEAMCHNKRSLADFEGESVVFYANQQLTDKQARMMSSLLPEKLTLPGGRQVPIHYEEGKPPWIESRLQDFFGMGQGPALCEGRIPIVLHLLAPNYRAVQVTTDLAGFWSRHYPAIRKELARKYPRHSWPEDPTHAIPPAPKRSR